MLDTLGRQIKTQDTAAATNSGVCGGGSGSGGLGTGDICSQNHVGSQAGPEDSLSGQTEVDMSKSEGTQAGGPMHQSVGTSTKSTGTRSKDYADEMVSGTFPIFMCLYIARASRNNLCRACFLFERILSFLTSSDHGIMM